MGRYIGYVVILLLYISFKGCDYSSLNKTTGVVVDERYFRYGRLNTASPRDVVAYPIARYKGPITRKMVLTLLYKPEESDPNLHPLKMYDTTYTDNDEYITTTPWGAYFWGEYHLGDTVDVIYDSYEPEQGRVCTIFSFWFTLPAICILIFLGLLWTGIHNLIISRVE